jgi:S-formylglutathione hydrolase FrmB
MALFQIDYFSQSLRRKVPLAIILPCDAPPELMPNMPEKFRALYLLHGYSASYLDWLIGAPLEDLAGRYGFAIITPAGENSFYLNDEARGALYEDYICKELPDFCRRFFPISKKKEDTIIGGLSMGGFGAIHSGFAHPEVFGNIIALSSALITDDISTLKDGEGNAIAPYGYYRHTFGPLDKLPGSHNDPKALARKLIEENSEIPNIYIACGTEDPLIEQNRDFHRCLQQLEIKHEYVEGPGAHDWVFWNAYILKGLAWIEEIRRRKYGEDSGSADNIK